MHRTVMEIAGSGCSSIIRQVIGVVFVLAVFMGRNMFADDIQAKTVTIEANPTYQVMIRRMLNPRTEEELRKELDMLKQKDGPHYRTLIPQLLYYSMHGTDAEGKRDVKEAMALGIIVEHLRVSNTTLAAALVPYLETGDAELQKELRGVLCRVDSPPGGRDYSYYHGILEHSFRRSKEPPLGLMRYMYEVDPGAALLTAMQASMLRERQQVRQILWAEHEIADVLWKHKHKFLEPDQVEPSAEEELQKLARSEHWWARLYVAEIMRQEPEFRTTELIERLQQDKHPLVRKTIEAFAKNAGHE